MAKLKVSIIDSHTLKLDEDGKVGDTIDLKSIQSVDESFIIESINSKRNETYNRLLEGVKKENESAIQLRLSEQSQKFIEDKNKLIQEKRELELKIENQMTVNKQNEEHITTKLKSAFDLERERLNNQLKSIEKDTKQLLQTEHKEILHAKEVELNALKLEREKLEMSFKLQLSDALKKLQEENYTKDKEIEALKRERSTRNIKTIGENLENWSAEQYKNVSLYGFKTSTFEKDNVVVRTEGETKGTKGDYIFKVYNNEAKDILLTSAMIEMKSEALESENKKKNSDHYKKLNEDRIKKSLEYAILVSELEYNFESDAPIFSVPEYEKMYVVRPHFFITLLGIIESIGMKYADIITDKETERIEFEASGKIIKDFEDFKNEILNNSIRHITTQLENIRTRSNTILSSVDAIQDSVRIILDSHLATVRNKIENYKIERITKHIDKLNA